MRALVLIALLATSCGTLRDVVTWPAQAKCLSTPTDAIVLAVSNVVAQDGLAGVFSDAAVDALSSLAKQYGPDVIACELRALIDAAVPSRGKAMAMRVDPEKLAGAGRAQTFLESHEIETVQP